MKAQSAADYEAALLAQAVSDYSWHGVRDEWDAGREGKAARHGWTLSLPPDHRMPGMYRAEIVALGHALLVHGDIDQVLFAYGATDSPEGLVRWIGNAGLRYAREKAGIGMGSVGVWSRDVGVAVHDLMALATSDDTDGDDVEALRDAVGYLECGEPVDLVLHDLWNANLEIEGEYLWDVGQVVSTRVIYAVAAVRRLADLLGLRNA